MKTIFEFVGIVLGITFSTLVFSLIFGGFLFGLDLALGLGIALGSYKVYTLFFAAVMLTIRSIKTAWNLDRNL